MKVLKDEIVRVSHARTGDFRAKSTRDFDTNKEEWYPLILVDEYVVGRATEWIKGEAIPCRNTLCTIYKLAKNE